MSGLGLVWVWKAGVWTAGVMYAALGKEHTHPPDTPFFLTPPLPSTPILTLSFAPIF